MVRDWRAGFRIEPWQGGTRVVAVSSFTPRHPLVRALGPVIRRRFHHAQADILAALQAATDEAARPSARPTR